MVNQVNRGREMVRHFTPNWFTATMGTGILALRSTNFLYT
jgi:tellurite resistance protein TehA-like permease